MKTNISFDYSHFKEGSVSLSHIGCSCCVDDFGEPSSPSDIADLLLDISEKQLELSKIYGYLLDKLSSKISNKEDV